MTAYFDELDLLTHIETLLCQLLEVYPEPANGEAAALTAVQTARNALIQNDKSVKGE
jgi:hypothetical protein